MPREVRLVAAVKGRTPPEIMEAIEAGVKIIGENYVQEAEKVRPFIKVDVDWHLIGHLQKNKARKAVPIFDMIETIDSLELAKEIDRACAQAGKIMPVLIEINSGREAQKAGVLPENAEPIIREVSRLPNIKVMGLMTMGPRAGNPEDFRPYFKETRRVFELIKGLNLANVEMKHLSMGMSNSYRVAIEEGATIIRIGSKIFGGG